MSNESYPKFNTSDETHSLILDQPWQLEMFRLLQLKYAMRIEVQTGLRHSRGSILKAINEVLLRNNFIDRPHRTKRAALESLEAYIAEKEQKALLSKNNV
jgi:hypothetical protein